MGEIYLNAKEYEKAGARLNYINENVTENRAYSLVKRTFSNTISLWFEKRSSIITNVISLKHYLIRVHQTLIESKIM